MGACLLPVVLALGTHVGGAAPSPREIPTPGGTGVSPGGTGVSPVSLDRDYTFQWWAYGWRGLSPEGRHVLCFQTGSLGMALDVDRLEIRHLGRILHPKPYREAVADDNQVVFGLPPAKLLLEVVAGPRRYRAVRAGFPSRIIESGRFFQRSDLQALVFEDPQGAKLKASGRLEIGVWPDRAALVLEVTPNADLADAMPRVLLADGAGDAAPGQSPTPGPWKAGQVQTAWVAWPPQPAAPRRQDAAPQAVDLRDPARPVAVTYEPAYDWYRVALPCPAWRVADEPDHLDRVRLKLRNSSQRPQVVRLLFAKEGGFEGVTGMSPMLRDADGHPIGIPIQISKNWHVKGERLLYQGPWFHGLTMLRLPAASTAEYEFTMAYARWGGVPAASHAQLCLIGWGVDQLWDQAAIGSWGESICYDPDVNLQRSMIDDVRPLMVWGMNQDRARWTWTNNVGGGDFLVYFDASGKKQFLARVRTAYLAQCPNLTEVHYAGVTPDGGIAARIAVSTPRVDDYNRAFHRFRYDVLKPTRFTRLAFYQLGADHYNDAPVRRWVRGNAGGMVQSWEPGPDLPKQEGYVRTGVPCEGPVPWFSLSHPQRQDPKGGAWADRGLIVRHWKARLGGKDVPVPYVASFRTGTQAGNVNCELVPPPGLHDLLPGDFVEGEVHLVVMPIVAEHYYGPNKSLRGAMGAMEKAGQPWKMIHREAVGNDLEVTATRGKIVRRYPVLVEVDAEGRAEFSVRGGVGHVPITLAGVKHYRGFRLDRSDGGPWTPIDQSVHGNDFWQTDYDAAAWRLTYNVPLDTPGDARQTVHFRFGPE